MRRIYQTKSTLVITPQTAANVENIFYGRPAAKVNVGILGIDLCMWIFKSLCTKPQITMFTGCRSWIFRGIGKQGSVSVKSTGLPFNITNKIFVAVAFKCLENFSEKLRVTLSLLRNFLYKFSGKLNKIKMFRGSFLNILKTKIILLRNASFVFYVGAVCFDLISQTEKEFTLIKHY